MKNYMWMKRKKCEKKKIQMKKKRMRMKCENEMKRKEGRKGVMWWEKERIGGWSRSENLYSTSYMTLHLALFFFFD